MNKELEEAIKRIRILLNDSCDCEECKKDKKAYKTVLTELKRLQEENKDLKQANREKADKLIEITDLYMRSIPNDKIREKIEDIKDMKVEGEVFITAVNFSKKILEELLEEK